jgi:hypothetical protein
MPKSWSFAKETYSEAKETYSEAKETYSEAKETYHAPHESILLSIFANSKVLVFQGDPEVCVGVKRDLIQSQKRPNTKPKETYLTLAYLRD